MADLEKFFKLTEIWCIDRLLYAHMDFMFIFSLFCHSYSFGQIWYQNLKFVKLTKMLYFDVYFFKILIIHSFGLIWSHKLKISILTEIRCSVALLYVCMILMLIFSKHFVIHIVLGKFGPKAVLPTHWNLAFVYIHY